jgi:hypothetical protein
MAMNLRCTSLERMSNSCIVLEEEMKEGESMEGKEVKGTLENVDVQGETLVEGQAMVVVVAMKEMDWVV